MAALSSQILFTEAKCFACYGASSAQLLRVAILVRTLNTLDPMAATDPQSLVEYAKCFNCYSNGSVVDLMELALLDQISQNVSTGGGGEGNLTGIGSPEGVVTANKGRIYFDMTDPPNPVMWIKTTDGGNTGWV